MTFRLLLSVYLITFVRAMEWSSLNLMSETPRPYMVSEMNAGSKIDNNMAYNNPFLGNNFQVSGTHSHVLEIRSEDTKCYTSNSMMNIVRGILKYLNEKPNQISYLNNLISVSYDNEASRSGAPDFNRFGAVVNIIDKDESLPQQEKKALRELLYVEEREPLVKTRVVFKSELPSLNQPHCKDVFMKLMEVAHDAYMQLAKYPTCQTTYDVNYDKSNNKQPAIPKGQIYFPDPFPYNVEPDIKYKPNVPNNPDSDDYLTKIKYFIHSSEEHSNDHKKDDVNDYFQHILKGLTENPNQATPGQSWPLVYPAIEPNPKPNYEYTTPFGILETPNQFYDNVVINPPAPVKDNGDDKFIEFLYGIKPNSVNELVKYLLAYFNYNKGNTLQNPVIIGKITNLMKPFVHDVSYGTIATLVELVRNTKAAHASPKLIEIIFPLIKKIKAVPDPKVLQIVISLLKPNVQREMNPKMIELILTLLKLNKEDVSKERYQILLSLLHPDDTGEINPKLIEIISSLLKVNENSTPNNKIMQILVSFLNVSNGINPKNIDTLLYLLKLNNNHSIPEQLYKKIVQLLIQYTMSKNVVPYFNNYNDNYHMQQILQGMVFDKNPYLMHNLLPGNLHAAMPNQFNSNMSGVIELTYLLKHPKPLVYEPFYYVKYRLPLPTFVANVKNLLLKDPLLTSNPTKLYQTLITISNVTEVSPNLKGYSKADILRLTFNNGALVNTKVTDNDNMNFKEQIKLLQDLNADVQPESLLEQSGHIFSDQEFKDKTQKLDPFWSAMHPVARETNMASK